MGGACSAYGERRGVYMVLVGEPEGRRMRSGEDNKMDIREVGCGVWNGSSWLRIGTDIIMNT